MRALITGGAGFIGSSLAKRLADEGHQIVIADSFTPYYDPAQKRANLVPLRDRPGVRVVEVDLAFGDLDPLLDDIDVVFHQAAQPGVRRSWDDFGSYVAANITVTQRLLDAVLRRGEVRRFVYASSSSVYGNCVGGQSAESDRPQPFSPYGVTKLAAEHLCCAYAENFGLPTVSLRYFTVYGPGQRPDMAIHRLIEAARNGTPFPLYGDGRQMRDFTYVDDVVAANLAAVGSDPPPGTVANVAGGSSTTVGEVVELIGELVGRPLSIDARPPRPGDVLATAALTHVASQVLGWEPRTDLRTGVGRQVAWHAERAAVAYA
jgi:nucleoside-diphosphate-sugar epimerase